MMNLLYAWFGVVGLDPAAIPVDMSELIPYLLQVCVAVVVTGLVFSTIVQLAKLFTEWRWR